MLLRDTARCSRLSGSTFGILTCRHAPRNSALIISCAVVLFSCRDSLSGHALFTRLFVAKMRTFNFDLPIWRGLATIRSSGCHRCSCRACAVRRSNSEWFRSSAADAIDHFVNGQSGLRGSVHLWQQDSPFALANSSMLVATVSASRLTIMVRFLSRRRCLPGLFLASRF